MPTGPTINYVAELLNDYEILELLSSPQINKFFTGESMQNTINAIKSGPQLTVKDKDLKKGERFKPLPVEPHAVLEELKSLRQRYDQMVGERDWHLERVLEADKQIREMVKELDNSIDLEETYETIVKFTKFHKLNYKPLKGPDIVRRFVAALDFRQEPIDDELVD